jgi:hypothetical protein
MEGLFAEPNSFCLRFDSQNDAINFTSDRVENGNGWLATYSLDFAKRYKEGNVYVVLELRIGASAREYDFVFFAVPIWRVDGTAARNGHMVDVNLVGCHPHRYNDTVFAYIASTVKSPNEVIASLVRIERPKERNDVRRNIFASALNHTVKFSSRTGDGEVCRPGMFDAGKDGSCKGSLIKGRTETFDSLGSDTCDTGGKCLCEFDLVKIIDSIIVTLGNACVGLVIKEMLDPTVEIANVLLCSRDTHPGAGEGVVHEPSNVQGQGRCAASSRSVPCTAGLGSISWGTLDCMFRGVKITPEFHRIGSAIFNMTAECLLNGKVIR